MAQHHDLDVLVSLAPSAKSQELEESPEYYIEEGEHHGPRIVPSRRPIDHPACSVLRIGFCTHGTNLGPPRPGIALRSGRRDPPGDRGHEGEHSRQAGQQVRLTMIEQLHRLEREARPEGEARGAGHALFMAWTRGRYLTSIHW